MLQMWKCYICFNFKNVEMLHLFLMLQMSKLAVFMKRFVFIFSFDNVCILQHNICPHLRTIYNVKPPQWYPQNKPRAHYVS